MQAQMNISDELHQSFRACEGAALAIAHVLRPTATKHDPPQNVLATFQEAQAFAITCRAVMDEAVPILNHLKSDAKCAGKYLTHNTSNTICNGYDSLALILIKLLDNATQAILDVAANHSRWLVTPLQATVTFERMVTHHGQLRGFYGIIHLASKISSHTTNTLKTLFVDIDERTEADMQPSKWRAAIKLDDFYGRHFGFHYTPEMRNVLRVVNIARGSVLKSHNEDDATPQLLKNAVMLGWGWIYSNMVLMDNLGLSIEGVSQIGADISPDALTIKQLRKFMNLVEEPLVAGVSGLASADVAMDSSFEIPTPTEEGGVPVMATNVTDDPLHDVLESITDSVRVRLMSYKYRPISLSRFRSKNRRQSAQKKPRPSHSSASPEEQNVSNGTVNQHQQHHHNGDTVYDSMNRTVSHVVSGVDILDEAVVSGDDEVILPSLSATEERPITSEERNATLVDSFTKNHRENGGEPSSTSGSPSVPSHSEDRVADPDRMDNSFLASTIKTEFRRLQTNVNSFLGIEEKKPATALIIYIHGGGFVSQSSESHVPHLKEWCFDIQDAVLLSVDYRLAPEHKFPRAIHECVYAYIWALQNANAIGTLAERVVFTGDSAGGNLAIATALKVAELGIRGPDGIGICYPALYLTTAWSPSRLLSFFDPMLPVSVLELCLKSYIPDGIDPKKNALVSPMVASDEQLLRLCPVTVITGSLDPLLDDAAVFMQRLHDLREGDTFRVYQSMPHGFLNLSQVNGTARSGMRFLSKMLAQYLGLPLRRKAKDEEDEIEAELGNRRDSVDGGHHEP